MSQAILARCIGLAMLTTICAAVTTSLAVAQNDQGGGANISDRFAANYGGSGFGVALFEQASGTFWCMYRLEGRAAPMYRVLRLPCDDADQADRIRLFAEQLRTRGMIQVEVHPAVDALTVKADGSDPVTFAIDPTMLEEHGEEGWKDVIDTSSIASMTLTHNALSSLLRRETGMTLDGIGDAWPWVLHAIGVYRSTQGPLAEEFCCDSQVACQSGGEGAKSCSLTNLGQTASVSCETGFYACCCIHAEHTAVLAHCCD